MLAQRRALSGNKHEHNSFNFHPLEAVERGSETQLQVGENLNENLRYNH